MKRLISTLLALILIVSLVGCGAKKPVESPEEQEPAESVGSTQAEEVSFIWIDDQIGEVLEEIRTSYVLEPFAEVYPEIKIDWRPTADASSQARIMLAGGDGADLMCADGAPDALELYADGRTMDLRGIVEEYGLNDTVYSWALDACTTEDGAITGIPVSWEGMTLFWNKDILEKEGWKVPETYEDLLAINEVVREKGYVAPLHQGSSGMSVCNEWLISIMLGAYSGREATQQLLTGELTFQDEPIRGAFAMLEEIWNNGVLGNQDTYAITRDDSRALFLQGKIPFYMEGSWFLSTVMESGMNFGVGSLPSFRSDFTSEFPIAIGSILVVNKNTSPEALDAIGKLISFMFSKEELHMTAVADGMQPLPTDIDINAFPEDADQRYLEFLDILYGKMGSGEVSYCTWTFFPQETRTYLMENIENVYLKQITLDEYLNNAQEILNNDISQGLVPPLF